MERLTQMCDPGWGYCWTKLAFSDVAIMEDMIIDRLGAYEDTGLTPEEIIELKAKVELATPKKPCWICNDEPMCPTCCEIIDDGMEHCDSCDQRLDWSEE